MKYSYIVVAMIAFLLCGCPKPQVELNKEKSKVGVYGFEYDIRVFEYDGCEYICVGGGSSLTITHKGNCKYCQERNK
jgi:hypothetical protein